MRLPSSVERVSGIMCVLSMYSGRDAFVGSCAWFLDECPTSVRESCANVQAAAMNRGSSRCHSAPCMLYLSDGNLDELTEAFPASLPRAGKIPSPGRPSKDRNRSWEALDGKPWMGSPGKDG